MPQIVNAQKWHTSFVSHLAPRLMDSYDLVASARVSKQAELMSEIDYPLDMAKQLGIADKLIIVVDSDFSRTPWHNSSDGNKAHWSVVS